MVKASVLEKIVEYMIPKRRYLITKSLITDNIAKFSIERLKKPLNTFEVYSHSTGMFHSKEVEEKLFSLLS